MKCEDAKYKIQALIDKELPENEIDEVISHTESCYKCRNEYISLLQLEKKLKGVSFPDPEYDWFEEKRKKFIRSFSSFFGKMLVLFSFLVLFAWSVIELVKTSNTQPIIRISIAGLAAGIVILVVVSISDRITERKYDKYRSIKK